MIQDILHVDRVEKWVVAGSRVLLFVVSLWWVEFLARLLCYHSKWNRFCSWKSVKQELIRKIIFIRLEN
jgi:hypothetical protein